MHEIGTLQSLNQPKYKDIPITPEKITIGRSPKCTIVLSDIRCSGVHCEITPVSKNDWEFIVQDYSSNGTYINGIGKGNKNIAYWNDHLDILSNKVEPASRIAFIFLQPLKRKNQQSKLEKHKNQSPEAIEDEITCLICMEIMIKPICLYPCLHTFCEFCCLSWKNKSNECPTCRIVTIDYKKNQIYEDIINAFLLKYPEKKKITEKCEQCLLKIEGFMCLTHQNHIKCKQCNTLMPERPDCNQKCFICKDVYCNLYSFKCNSGINYLQNYFDKDMYVPSGCFNNIVEENIMSDYLRLNKVNVLDFYKTGVVIEPYGISLESPVCQPCANKTLVQVIEKLRIAANSKLPPFIQSKPKCPKGKNCLLQYSLLHIQKYAHV